MPTYLSDQGRVGQQRYHVTGATIPVRTPGKLVTDDCNGVLIREDESVMQRGVYVHRNRAWGGYDKPSGEGERVW